VCGCERGGEDLNDKIVEFILDSIGYCTQFPGMKNTGLINNRPHRIPLNNFPMRSSPTTPRIPPLLQPLNEFAFPGRQSRPIEPGSNVFNPRFLSVDALAIVASSFDEEVVGYDDFAGVGGRDDGVLSRVEELALEACSHQGTCFIAKDYRAVPVWDGVSRLEL
jgi:hypothetical protein